MPKEKAPVTFTIEFAAPTPDKTEEFERDFKRHALASGAVKAEVDKSGSKWVCKIEFGDVETAGRYGQYWQGLFGPIKVETY